MATYAIGDLQGCLDDVHRLLERLAFDPAQDRLWFAGDLVNRGPRSLDTLRFIHGLGEAAQVVLGNHDLHLLAVDSGVQPARPRDTLGPILAAPDRPELLHWLRCQPLIHHDPVLGYAMVHAGLPPQWDLAQAQALAAEVSATLCGPEADEFLAHMYGNQPDRWSDDLKGWDRLRFITNACTRMRYCASDGRLDFREKGAPGEQPPHLLPWFQVPNRASQQTRIVFGHWSTVGDVREPNVYSLDFGCVWGGRLAALRLDEQDPRYIGVSCRGALTPGAD